MTTQEPTPSAKEASLPPRWFIRAAWVIHRAIYSLTRGRIGLRPATAKTWGMMRLATVGRRSGQKRKAILGYFEDEPNHISISYQSLTIEQFATLANAAFGHLNA